jgi:N-acetylmuramoyl-L-alanine amidase
MVSGCRASSGAPWLAALRGVLFLGLAAVSASAEAQQTAALANGQAEARTEPERVEGDASRTRFVIGLEREAAFQVFSLSNPNRVIVELPAVKMQLPALPGDEPVGLIKTFRGGLSAPGKSRVVIDVVAPVIVEKAEIEKGRDKTQSLVIDIVPAAAGSSDAQARTAAKVSAPPSGLGAAGVQPPLPRPAIRPQERAARTFRPVIVIDPGHGGNDSGAQKHGLVEKDIVLAVSKMLRDKLAATGRFKVLMTRETDEFVPLDSRREFAEKHEAALFIAVHVDYAGSHARGATIYSLREAMARDLRRSTRGTIGADVLSGKEIASVKQSADAGILKDILSDLAQREVDVNVERTSVFARSVIANMGASTSLRDNPDREANYRVLKTAKVPSVLIELAFVSNAEDAKLLRSESWRRSVANSLATSVENYFTNQIARLPL